MQRHPSIITLDVEPRGWKAAAAVQARAFMEKLQLAHIGVKRDRGFGCFAPVIPQVAPRVLAQAGQELVIRRAQDHPVAGDHCIELA